MKNYSDEYRQFADEIRANGCYTTAASKKKFRKSRLNSMRFYLKNSRNIYSNSMVAKKQGHFSDEQWGQTSYNVLKIAEERGGRFDIKGAEHCINRPGPVVFIGNHMSLVETLVLPCMITLGGKGSFVLKESLTRYPVFHHIINTTNPIAVGRANPREDLKAVLNGGKEKLANGHSVVIFPQSTRANHFIETEFNTLGAKLASKAGVPIVPVALKTDFMGNGKIIKDFGLVDPEKTIYFEFGAPIDSAKPKEAQAEVVEFIKGRLASWGA